MAFSYNEHVPLSELTTFKKGGCARYFSTVTSVGELADAWSFAQERGVPVLLLGGGSNLLVSDSDINALVVKVNVTGLEWRERDDVVEVTAGAGEIWDEVVRESVERGLFGLENLSGIPGTVGGAPVQNIGAYGVELKDVLSSVEVYDLARGEVKYLSADDCNFGYRDSIFKRDEGQGLVITRVTLSLDPHGKPFLEYADLKDRLNTTEEMLSPKTVRRCVLDIRNGKFPDLEHSGTAGSFFKNLIISRETYDELVSRYPGLPSYPVPGNDLVKIPVAWVLDNILGMKGYSHNGVSLFYRQPLVVVATEEAKSRDIYQFVSQVQDRIEETVGVRPEFEVRMWGEW